MSNTPPSPNTSDEYNLKNLVIGFTLSLMLTLAAYFTVTNAGEGLSNRALIGLNTAACPVTIFLAPWPGREATA